MTCTVRHDDITYALALSLFFCSLSHGLAFFLFFLPRLCSFQSDSLLPRFISAIYSCSPHYFLSLICFSHRRNPFPLPHQSLLPQVSHVKRRSDWILCVCVDIRDLHLNPQHYYTAIIISIVLKEALKLHCSLTKCKVSAWLTKRGLLSFHVFVFFLPGNYKTILTLWRIITSWKIRAAIGRPLEISGRGLGHVVSSLKWQIWDQMDSFYFLKQTETIVDAVKCCSLRKQVLKDTLFSLA